ncbi:Helix-turn-helix domain-containing protein [Paenibacillus sp. OK060]|uniref:helix-turn-helix domain-containing protein n=1 Tax=Paenibacillus sp. OK060 TaxID=1881034 RepID=UPI00088398D4|nr:AraC family transcriptional regulator [Paenibacillus sp. OK060]SDK20950.1 Helix-turn-helix domain-containing protein [Paenibacillus sp. OK060]
MSMRNGKIIKAPQEMERAPDKQGSLKQNGLSVIQFCLHTQGTTGSFFLKDHMLLFVISGVYTVRFKDQEYTVRSDEMVFLHKLIRIDYIKSGEPGSEFMLDYMMFFLNESMLEEFVQFSGFKQTNSVNQITPVSIIPVNELTRSYIASLKPYFEHPDKVQDGLVRLKFMELLFHLAQANEQFLHQLLQPNHNQNSNFGKIMEENITNPISIRDLAYLSGRSLSTFKRDFQTLYHTSPLKWIRNQRLDKAKKLLAETSLSVTDVCFSTGFENVAHFSKVFKLQFGLPPSEFRQQCKRSEEKIK